MASKERDKLYIFKVKVVTLLYWDETWVNQLAYFQGCRILAGRWF